MWIDTLTGNQTWKGSQASFNVLWVPNDKKKHVGLKECHLYVAGNQLRGGVSRLKSQTNNALVGMDKNAGFYVESRFDMNEGTVLKLSAFIREGAEDGDEGIKRFGQQYVRLREAAALRMVRMTLPNEHGKNRYPYAYIRGHFDLLTVEEALAYGVKTHKNFVKTFSKSRFKTLFVDDILTEEKEAATVMTSKAVVTGEGESEAVMMFEKVRKIRKR